MICSSNAVVFLPRERTPPRDAHPGATEDVEKQPVHRSLGASSAARAAPAYRSLGALAPVMRGGLGAAAPAHPPQEDEDPAVLRLLEKFQRNQI